MWLRDALPQIDICENYQKRSFRNKFDILCANGRYTLSIPLQKGKNNQQNITEVKISNNDNWQKNHIETIKSAYGRSPYFEHYFPSLEKVYTTESTSLLDFNNSGLQFILNSLKLDTELNFTKEFRIQSFSNELKFEKKYHQVFEYKFGFVVNLSCIDLIFNLGPEARLYFLRNDNF